MGKGYLVLAFVLAGSSVIAARFVSGYLPPFTTTFLSLVFAAATALLVCGKKMLKAAKGLPRARWCTIFLQAAVGSFLFRIFLTFGLRRINATQAGIIIGDTPPLQHC